MNGVAMIETIKSSGAENGYFERWAGYQASLNSANVKYSRTNIYLGLIPGFVSSVISYMVTFLGIYYAMFGNFTLGTIMTFQNYLSSFLSPAMSLIGASQTIQETRTEMERVEDVMNYPDDPYFNDVPYSNEIDYAKLKGNVEL